MMPSHADVLEQVEGQDQERAIATHQWYQAMCSSSYILLSSDDPLQIAFDMADDIKHLRNKLPVMRDDYNILRGQLEDFATKFLDFVRNGEEVKTMLSGGEDIGIELFPKLLRTAGAVDFKKVYNLYCEVSAHNWFTRTVYGFNIGLYVGFVTFSRFSFWH